MILKAVYKHFLAIVLTSVQKLYLVLYKILLMEQDLNVVTLQDHVYWQYVNSCVTAFLICQRKLLIKSCSLLEVNFIAIRIIFSKPYMVGNKKEVQE